MKKSKKNKTYNYMDEFTFLSPASTWVNKQYKKNKIRPVVK